MSLKDYRTDQEIFEESAETESEENVPLKDTGYQEEINTLRIDKLANRVTIISIILPCLIGAILVFAYLDMKERVVDVDTSKQSQYENISRQLEEKLNALDVKIAKNRLDLDNTLPEIRKKTVAIEGQLAKKGDASTIRARIAKIEKKVTAASSRFDTVSQETKQALKEIHEEFVKATKQIKEEITLFKEEFDARLRELAEYEQQIDVLRKDFSLMNKQQKNITREYIRKTELEKRIADTRNDFEARLKKLNSLITGLEEEIDRLDRSLSASKASGGKTSGPATKPSPQINIDGSNSQPVKGEPLSR